MGFISLAPELGVALAVKQWSEARRRANTMAREAPDVIYSMTHAFYAAMGGFVVRLVKAPPGSENPPATRRRTAQGFVRTIPGSDAVEKAGYVFLGDFESAEYPDGDGIFSVVDEGDIADRSKSDVFTKVFAILQSGWLILSSIARAYHGLAITELELATMAFILCALAMYAFWWNKPYGVEHRALLVQIRPPDDSAPLPGWRFQPSQRVPDMNWDDFTDLAIYHNPVNPKKRDAWPTQALYLCGMAFSAIHLIAWNWQFPNHLVQTLWRAAALVSFVVPTLPSVLSPFFYVVITLAKLEGFIGKTFSLVVAVMSDILPALSSLMLVCYVSSRLLIWALTLYCFTSMPASAYEKVGWTGYIPHFA